MKRFLAIIIALTMLMGLTATAESADLVYFGEYAYDASDCAEYEEPENGYTMFDYGSHVVTVEYFELASNGFDQTFFNDLDENDGYADSWEIASLLLSIKYGPGAEDNIYAWYEEEPIDNSFNVDCILFNGELTAELGSGAMAGCAFVTDGTLLLVEVISFSDYGISDMQELRVGYLPNVSYNGTPVVGSQGASSGNASSDSMATIGALMGGGSTGTDTPAEEPADEPAETTSSTNNLGNMSIISTTPADDDADDVPAGNNLGAFGGTVNPTPAPAEEPAVEEDDTTESTGLSLSGIGGSLGGTSDDESEAATDPGAALSGIGGSLSGTSDDDGEAATDPGAALSGIGGSIGANISGGASAAPDSISGIELGKYVFDVTGSVEHELTGNELMVDYGAQVIYIEYGTFEEYGFSFDELADIGGIDHNCLDMAKLFFNSTSYADPASELYAGCVASEFTDIAVYPEGVMFVGNLTEDYGSGPVIGCILITEYDILMFECVSFGYDDTTESMTEFFYNAIGNLGYEGVPVIR